VVGVGGGWVGGLAVVVGWGLMGLCAEMVFLEGLSIKRKASS
jgi:hypothetical protein